MTGDAELLRRYAGNRDEAAFAELVQRHLGLVYHAALRQCGGDAHRAEDVAQAVFTDLARKAEKLARRPVLAGWLYTSTRYAAAQAVRTEARRQAREQEAHAMNEIFSQTNSSSPAESVAEWELLRPVIDDALHALGERDREAVLLRFFEGRTFAEVGAKLLLSEDAARMRVERALEKLRAALVRRGITSTTAALGVALANQAAAAAPAGLATSVTGAALAGAVASGGSTMGLNLLNLMNTSKTMAGIAGMIAVVAISTAVYETGVVHTTRASLAAADRERSDLGARLRRVEDDAKKSARLLLESTETVASLHAQIDALRSAKGGMGNVRNGGTASASTTPVLSTAAFQDLLISNPDYQRLVTKRDRAATRLQYGPLFQRLHLSPAQITAFENRWLEYTQENSDMAAAAVAQGVSTSDPSFAPLAKKIMEERAQSLITDMQVLIGPDGAKEFDDYRGTFAARELVGSLAGNVFYSAAPLTAEQGEQLAKIIADNSASYQAGGYVKATDINWTAALSRAEGVLSGPQLAALRSSVEQQQVQQQIYRLTTSLQRR